MGHSTASTTRSIRTNGSTIHLWELHRYQTTPSFRHLLLHWMIMYTVKSSLRRVATTLKLPTEDVRESQSEFLDILQQTGHTRLVLPIHKAILQPAQVIWHTPAFCAPTLKCAECRYLVPAKNTNLLFMHPPPNSLVVQAAV